MNYCASIVRIHSGYSFISNILESICSFIFSFAEMLKIAFALLLSKIWDLLTKYSMLTLAAHILNKIQHLTYSEKGQKCDTDLTCLDKDKSERSCVTQLVVGVQQEGMLNCVKIIVYL